MSLPVSRSQDWVNLGQERTQRKGENEIGVSGRSHFLRFKKKKKMEVQSPEFRLTDHETESAKAEGPGS